MLRLLTCHAVLKSLWSVCFQEFQEFWAEYDDGSGTIAPEQLQTLLIRTDPPLGLGRMATGRDVLKFVFNLDIPLVNGRVPFHRTVYELVRNVSETQIPEVNVHTVTSALQRRLHTLKVQSFSIAIVSMFAPETMRKSTACCILSLRITGSIQPCRACGMSWHISAAPSARMVNFRGYVKLPEQ